MVRRETKAFQVAICDKCGAEGQAVLDDGDPVATRRRWLDMGRYAADQGFKAPTPKGRWKCEACRTGIGAASSWTRGWKAVGCGVGRSG